MIKVVVVDDDIAMLKGLETIIDWESYGFELGIGSKSEKGIAYNSGIKARILEYRYFYACYGWC
jgi:hypothetical protein